MRSAATTTKVPMGSFRMSMPMWLVLWRIYPRHHSTDGFCAEREVNVPSEGKGSDGTRSAGEKEKKLGSKAREPVAADFPRRHLSYTSVARQQ